ncbi:MAG: TIGR03619 family F420-dependent LLM class oxidoreductase [bacterium]|nr:TIGR03619 family F420-dependent LLM class oxidoreductase [bacterium]
MDYWLYLTGEDERQYVDLARHAEAAGLRGVAIADHVAVPVRFDSIHPSGAPAPFDHRSSFPDPMTFAAAILASTETLEVMPYVYILPMREPFSVAKQAATLAVLSDGRFRMGVGAGWLFEEIELMGQAVARRGRRMDEMLEIVRGFWTQESVEFHGEFFDFAPAGMAPRPAKPVPIWVGGKSDAALARAVRQDGWLGMNYDLPEVHALLERLAAMRAEAPPREEPFEVFVIPNAEPSPDLHAELGERGVTSTLAFAWPAGDPAFDSLSAKQQAIDAFAKSYLGR